MFSVGDYVRIRRSGRRYTTYFDFFKQCPEYREQYMLNYNDNNGSPKNKECATILFVGKHSCGWDLAVIKIDDRDGVFLFDANKDAFDLICRSAPSNLPEINTDDFEALIFGLA